MPHRPNPIPRFNNQQYANTSLTPGQSTSSTVQNTPHSGANSSRRDLSTIPPRHRGHSFSSTTPPSIANQDGNISNRGERTGGAGHRTLPPPRFQRKQRPPRVQNILAGPDNIDRSLGTLTFGPATNWGVGTQSVVSLPMAAVNAASSAVGPSANLTPKVVSSSSSTLNTSMDDFSLGFATRQINVDSVPQPTNNSPPHLSFGRSVSIPHSTSLPDPPTCLVSFDIFINFWLHWVQTIRSNAHTSLCQLRVPSREDPTLGSCAPSVLAPYFASALVTINGDYMAHHSLDEPHPATPSVGSVQPLSRDITPPKDGPVPPAPLRTALKHQCSIPNLAHAVYSVPEKPLPSTPELHSAHNFTYIGDRGVTSRSPYVGGPEYEQDIIGADEDGLQPPDEELTHYSHRGSLDEWEEFDEALKMYAAGVVEDEECLAVSLGPRASRPVVRVSPPSLALPTGFAESTAFTRTARSRPVSTLSAHTHRIPLHVPQLRSHSRSPSPTPSGNGSCESAGSMGSLPGLGSFGSGSTVGTKLSPQSTPSSRPPNMFSSNASMASLTSRSTISSGRSLRTVDSYGSLRSTASGAFGAGPLLGGSSIWAMDKEEAGVGVGTVGVTSGSTLSLVPEEGPGFSGNGYRLPKGAAPALEPFGAFEPTPRRKNRPVSGFSNATYVFHLLSLIILTNQTGLRTCPRRQQRILFMHAPHLGSPITRLHRWRRSAALHLQARRVNQLDSILSHSTYR